MDQLPLDMLLCILAYINSKTLISICSVSRRFVELNLESLLRQKLIQLSHLNLKNHNLKRLIKLIKFPFKRDRISIGGHHSIILNDSILTFGSNCYGQLGLGDDINRNIPTLIIDIHNIIAISAGHRHSMILNDSGQIYTFGTNDAGQLGLGNNTWRKRPTLTSDIYNSIAISASDNYSMILDEHSQIYTFGNNEYGQLGLGDNTNRNIPTLINNMNKIITISTGEY